jgi:ferredoxin
VSPDAVALRIDRIRCDGYGMCAELLPELILLDDWGYPIQRPGSVPPHLIDHARRAVEVCPVIALRLVTSPAAAPPGAILDTSRTSRPRP